MSEAIKETQEIVDETSRESSAVTVGEAIREGAADAKRAMSSVSSLVSKTVYSACYGVSFGVTFGALMVAKLIPSDTIVAKGMRDGAVAAKASLQKHRETVEHGEATVTAM